MPNWVTAERQAQLLELFQRTGNKCLHGHSVCPIPEHYLFTELKRVQYAKSEMVKFGDGQLETFPVHTGQVKIVSIARMYDVLESGIVKYWVDGDRVDSRRERIAEQKILHDLAELPTKARGRFNAISREIYASNQPLYYVEAMGISPVDLKPYALVKIASSKTRLYIDVSESLKYRAKVSVNARRKAKRYGRGIPITQDRAISQIIRLAVMDYLK